MQVALPAVQADLGIPTHQLRWVITAYTLAYGGLLLLGGRLGDLYGRRRMLTSGMILLAAASALGGLATGAGALVAVRVLKGLGAAGGAPAVMSLLTTTFPEGEARSRALGFDPLQAGCAFLPQEAVVLALSPLLGRTVARTGARPVLAAGVLGFGAAVLTVARISAGGGYVSAVLPGVMLAGVGVACTIVAGAVVATTGIPAHLQGLASGLWNTAPQIGSSLGRAVLISVANVKTGGALAGARGTMDSSLATWLPGFRAAFTAALLFVVAGLWAVLFWMRPPVETPGASTRSGS